MRWKWQLGRQRWSPWSLWEYPKCVPSLFQDNPSQSQRLGSPFLNSITRRKTRTVLFISSGRRSWGGRILVHLRKIWPPSVWLVQDVLVGSRKTSWSVQDFLLEGIRIAKMRGACSYALSNSSPRVAPSSCQTTSCRLAVKCTSTDPRG
jgi:hypothetical protein